MQWALAGELVEEISISTFSLCTEGDGVGSGMGPKGRERGSKFDASIDGNTGADKFRLWY